MDSQTLYFLEFTVDWRLADGIFPTLEAAREAAEELRKQHDLADRPLQWYGCDNMVSEAAGISISIQPFIVGEIEEHSGLVDYESALSNE